MRSDATKVEIELRPLIPSTNYHGGRYSFCLEQVLGRVQSKEAKQTHPPPIPATTRPKRMTHSSFARPHISVPPPKQMAEYTRPIFLPKISVNRPLSGCIAALAIKYDDASHESRVKELNEFDIGVDSVATIVESAQIVSQIISQTVQKKFCHNNTIRPCYGG
jgi:hypothetical protein